MYDKKEFVDGLIEKRLNLVEIAKEARREIQETQSGSHRVKGAKAKRGAGSGEYGWFLRALVFFLESEPKSRPAGLSNDDFQLLLPLAEQLIGRGDFQASVLELF